ncbi:MAG: hypothetical protein ACR2RD_05145 [Woeseiaceae bacterium]
MPKTISALVSMALVLIAPSGVIAADNPLFGSNKPLALILEFPLKELLQQKKAKATVLGVLRYVDVDGNSVVLDVGVSTRGNSRLEQCRYPPLRINLKKKQVKSTLFAGQNDLKLVTLCRDTGTYRRYLSQEYTLYRAYNLVSDYSFRARMLEIIYRDPSGRQPKGALPAFFIESDNALAKRLGMTRIKSKVIVDSQLDVVQLSILTLFQFIIGNTDWSVHKGPGSEYCCHNGKVIGPPDSHAGWVVIPYDFDQSGLINTSYARPAESLPIKSVRQRWYRGFCSGNGQIEATIAQFNNKRSALEELFIDNPDGPSENKAALEYLRSSFAIVNDPTKRQKQVVNRCRGNQGEAPT